MSKAAASCVIRTLNEAKHLDSLIKALLAQEECGGPIEIVVVDSGSTDGTKNILARHGITPIVIDGAGFNYSEALNLGISHSLSDLILVLSGHSVPLGTTWLKAIARHFAASDIAGVYSRQVPWPRADLYEQIRLEKSFGSVPVIFTRENRAGMHFSNAASCLRRTVWEEHPFTVMPAAEDAEWAGWALQHGYKIVYEPTAQVYHSHSESCRKAARRIIEIERSIDLHKCERRTRLRTAKQSIGWLVRDATSLSSVKASSSRKLLSLSRSLRKCFWYAVDFNRV
jgi:rhamnosyltransferase